MNKFSRTVISIILVIFFAVGIYNFAIGTYNIGIFAAKVVLAKVTGTPQKTILVMGTDKGGLRTDVMMLCFIGGKDNKVDIVSIPRDTKVKIGSKYYKINSAYSLGQEEQTIETTEKLLDIEIDGYVTFSCETFRETIDAMGGLYFDVPQDMFYEDPYQDLYIDLEEGHQHLNGKEAEGLVRYRRYPTGDEGRIEVQQEFIREMVKQKANLGMIFSLPAIMTAIEENIDTDLDAEDIATFAAVALWAGTDGVSTYQLPGGPQYQGGVSYYIYNSSESEKLIHAISDK